MKSSILLNYVRKLEKKYWGIIRLHRDDHPLTYPWAHLYNYVNNYLNKNEIKQKKNKKA